MNLRTKPLKGLRLVVATIVTNILLFWPLRLFAADTFGGGTGPRAPQLAAALAAVCDSAPWRLALTIANATNETVKLDGGMIKGGRLSVAAPDQTTMECPGVVPWETDASAILLKAGESRTWFVDFGSVRKEHALDKPGTYRVRWVMDDFASNEVLLRVEPIRLALAVVRDSSPTRLLFTLRNDGPEPFATTPVCTNYNRIVVTTEEGKETEVFFWKRGIAQIEVGPGRSCTWELDIGRTLGGYSLPMDEPLTLHWRVRHYKSAPLVLSPVANRERSSPNLTIEFPVAPE